MRTAKKALGIILVLAMLLNVVALVSYAEVPADTVCNLSLKADRANYMPGDEIVLTVYAQTAAECPQVTMAGQYEIGYPSAAIEPYSTSASLLDQGFTPASTQTSFSNSESQFVSNSVMIENSLSSVTEGQGFDAICGYWISQPENNFQDSVDAPVELFSFKMKVTADAADGDYVIGFNKNGYDGYNAYITDSVASGLYGSVGADYGFTSTNMFSFESVTIHVGATAEPSILEYSKAQIRFKGIGATSPAADYQGSFDVRTVAKISQADFLATFGSEDAAKNATTGITEFGFVYAAKSNVTDADFNIDTAKAVAKGEATDANYVKKTVTYMQHTGDGADYTFTCLIKDIADADKTDGVNCIAFVKYGEAGEYIFFDAAASVNYSDLYNQYMPKA